MTRPSDSIRAQMRATDYRTVRNREARHLAEIHRALGLTVQRGPQRRDARIHATWRAEIEPALFAAHGNVTEAAGLLGTKRTTLAARMKVLGVAAGGGM